MNRNRDVIETDIMTLVFYMQGGITYNDAWMLTSDQRQKMSKVIEKHYDAVSGNDKKNML